MGILQTKRRTTGKKALAYRGKADQNTDTALLALTWWTVRIFSIFVCSGRGKGGV